MACIRKNEEYITHTQAIFGDPGMLCFQNQCLHMALSVDLIVHYPRSKSLANA